MSEAAPALRKRLPYYIFILVLPFCLLYWLIPHLSSYTLGMDYLNFSIENQLELMFSIRTGSFPLYVPGFEVGSPASALTLGEVFHPLPHLARLLPGYWDGEALNWNTLLRLLSLAAAHLFLFILLVRLGLGRLAALVVSAVTVYNLRMLDLFRYGASLESWTGCLFLCAAIGWHYLHPGRRSGPLCIIGASYWLVTSGHPQMAYFGFLGAGLFTLILPGIAAALPGERPGDAWSYRGFCLRTALWCGAGLLLAAAYILPFYFEFLSDNARSASGYYGWADSYRDTLAGTLNSFMNPLEADVHGGFGGASLILAAALTPLLRLFGVRPPRAVWALWGTILCVFLYMQGGRLPLHGLIWKYFPFASSFRIAGRISLVLPVLLMLLLAWIIRAPRFGLSLGGRRFDVAPRTLLAGAALLATGLYLLLPASLVAGGTDYAPAAINHPPTWVEPLALALGALALAALAVHGVLRRGGRAAGAALAVLLLATLFQTGVNLRYGTWRAKNRPMTTSAERLAQKKIRLGYAPRAGTGAVSTVVQRQAERSFIEPILAQYYPEYVQARSSDEAYELMERERTPRRAVAEGCRASFPAGGAAAAGGPDRVRMIYNHFNRIAFEVDAAKPGLLGMSYPFTGRWTASLDGRPVEVCRVNGAAHGAAVPAGRSIVEFRYRSPASLWGMALSCAALAVIGLGFGFTAPRRPLGTLAGLAALVLAIGLFAFWHGSLYAGESLGTRYEWKAPPAPDRPNLAYSKRTRITTPTHYALTSGRAVDGDRTPESGFLTRAVLNPKWVVDLYRPYRIGEIVVYESRTYPDLNQRPVTVWISVDGVDWKTVAALPESKGEAVHRIRLPDAPTARYVSLQAAGVCQMSFDEVEVYPPEESGPAAKP